MMQQPRRLDVSRSPSCPGTISAQSTRLHPIRQRGQCTKAVALSQEQTLPHQLQAEESTDRPPQCLLAVRRSLAERPIHDTGNGRLVVPLLEPAADDLPFSVALELHRHSSGAQPSPPSQAQQRSYQLHYVLQGQAQLVQEGQALGRVQAGDSLLMSSGAAHCQTTASRPSASDSSSSSSNEWQLAALTLVLGAHQGSDPETSDSDGDLSFSTRPVVDCTVAQQIADEWQAAPMVGNLPAATVQRIVTCAQETAMQLQSQQQQQQAGQAPELHSNQAAPAAHEDQQTFTANVATQHGSASSRNERASHRWYQRLALGTISRSLLSGLPALWSGLQSHLTKRQQQHAVQHLEASLTSSSGTDGVKVHQRRLRDLLAYQLPGQTNRLALLFNPVGAHAMHTGGQLPHSTSLAGAGLKPSGQRELQSVKFPLNEPSFPEDVGCLPQLDDMGIPFTFGLEIFEPGHKTPPHTHQAAHELFFILSGSGIAFCDGQSFVISAGDVLVFPPTSVHGIDNGLTDKLFCLELMLPNEMFAEFVKKGLLTGNLSDEDMCTLVAEQCGYASET